MQNYDMNAIRAKNGYLVGFEDMEDHIVKMIQEAYLSSQRTVEQFEIIKRKFEDLKRES
jgi:hypothetical protein